MRILIYGFGPYRQFQDNVTEKILRRLPKRPWLKKIVFPVKFNRRQFVEAVKRHRPEIILGLGQRSRGRRLRIEGRAVNKWRNSKREKPKPIIKGGSRSLPANFRLNMGPQARSSRNAGDYVCNYSMYVILDSLKRRRLPIHYGFVHVPHDFNPRRASLILVKAIDKIEAASFR